MTLKQSQGHQTYNENVDPEQGYNHAKFEWSRFNSVKEKGSIQDFFLNKENVHYFLWIEHVWKKKKKK